MNYSIQDKYETDLTTCVSTNGHSFVDALFVLPQK